MTSSTRQSTQAPLSSIRTPQPGLTSYNSEQSHPHPSEEVARDYGREPNLMWWEAAIAGPMLAGVESADDVEGRPGGGWMRCSLLWSHEVSKRLRPFLISSFFTPLVLPVPLAFLHLNVLFPLSSCDLAFFSLTLSGFFFVSVRPPVSPLPTLIDRTDSLHPSSNALDFSLLVIIPPSL